MFEELFYWTGAFAWFMLSTEIVLWLTGYFIVPCWNRKIRPSISNLRFGLTGKLNLRMSCYDRWDMIYHRPALHHYWRSRENFRRFSYKRLIREARKEYRENFQEK